MQESAHEHQTRCCLRCARSVCRTGCGLFGIRYRANPIVSNKNRTPRLCNLKNPAHNVETCPRCQRLLRSPEARKNLREKKKADRRTEKEYDAKRNPIRVVQGGLGSGNK